MTLPLIVTEEDAIAVWKAFNERVEAAVALPGTLSTKELSDRLGKNISDADRQFVDARLQGLDEKKRATLERMVRLWKEKSKHNTRTILDLRRNYSADVHHFFRLQYQEIRKDIARYLQACWLAAGDQETHNMDAHVDLFLRAYNRALWQAQGENISASFIQRYTKEFLKVEIDLAGAEALLKKLETLERSLNFEKIEILFQALEQGEWEHAIFSDPELPFMTMTLYINGKITRQQITSILYRQSVIKDFTVQPGETYRILDDAGEFTAEAKKFLLPLFEKFNLLPNFTDLEIEHFRLLVKTLPRSEQYFFLSSKEPVSKAGNKHTEKVIRSLKSLDSVWSSAGKYVHLAYGAQDALSIMRFGVDSYALPLARVGAMGMREIEHGMRVGARYTALHYPRPQIWQDIHGAPTYGFVATLHDAAYHARVVSAFPDFFKQALLRFVDVTRQAVSEAFAQKPEDIWSKEIWNWIDAEFNQFLFHPDFVQKTFETDEEKTNTLCFILTLKSSYYERQFPNRYAQSHLGSSSLVQYGQLTPVGMIILLDMLDKTEEWKKIGIDPQFLILQIGDHYQSIKTIYNDLQSNPLLIRLLKISVYLDLKSRKQLHLWEDINRHIDENHVFILEKLKFDKYKKSNIARPNVIYLNFADMALETRNAFVRVVYVSEAANYADATDKDAYTYLRTKENATRAQAAMYVKLLYKGLDQADAKFYVLPSVWNWMRANPVKTIVCIVSLVGMIALPFLISLTRKKAHSTILKIEAREKLIPVSTVPRAFVAVSPEPVSTAQASLSASQKNVGQEERSMHFLKRENRCKP